MWKGTLDMGVILATNREIFITIKWLGIWETHLYKKCEKTLEKQNNVLSLLIKNLFHELNKKIL